MMAARESSATLGLKLVADVGRFVWRLFRSPRVPLRVKVLLAGLGAYLASPVDIIPDGLPVIGYLDDAFIAAAALGLVAKWIPKDVISELWESDVSFDDALAALRLSVKRLRRGKK